MVRTARFAMAAMFAGAAAFAVASSAGASAPLQAKSFLGYEVGEERRFRLGPAEALGRAETGSWAIRLIEVFGAGADAEGVFELGHEWHAAMVSTEVPFRMITRVNSAGRLRVNAHGFPLVIAYRTVRHLAGLGDESYTINYTYENKRYEVRTNAGDALTQRVAIRGHEHLDHDGPAGLFAFLPAPPGCFDRRVISWDSSAQVVPPPSRPNAASQGQQAAAVPSTNRLADNADCEESMFLNPGLLSLAMPAFWEARGEREFLFFTPVGPMNERTTAISGSMRRSGGAPGAGMPLGATGTPSGSYGPERLMSSTSITPTTYHEIENLRYVEMTAVKIGTRTRDLWKLEGPDHLGAIYVDGDGVVMRIDLPKLHDDEPQRWIRMLFPSEF